ncbi:MAG: molybdopterin molybdenumtransferase MoeA [Desulfobacteraceae bacterium]|nr:MAG: molybdopterin molybdenumtransferase MoeA [Desulfobacteraceae bacterium]
MKSFFKVKSLEQVMEQVPGFDCLGSESVPVSESVGRILAQDLVAQKDLPGFRRSTMDGFAVAAASTFGASESSPAWLEISGTIGMGDIPDFELMPGKAARISTGGMLPKGADSVIMVEHTQLVDDLSVEIFKSVAPLQHVIDVSEDFARHDRILTQGSLIRPQEAGLAAGLGFEVLELYRTPRVGIISTGDEVVPVHAEPNPGQIRDINSYALAGFVEQAGARAVAYGIVPDDPDQLRAVCETALTQTDMVLISGGSSVGSRDYTVEVLQSLPDTRILVHGISLSPGKPTILARSGRVPVFGLPGQVTSAMVVFQIVVTPFLNRLKGDLQLNRQTRIPAVLSRNIASAQGRTDYVRVSLTKDTKGYIAEPVLGKSGLIRTMVMADGLVEIPENTEGYEKGTLVDVILI